MNNINEKLYNEDMSNLFPIGVLVKLRGNNNPCFITSRIVYDENNKLYDYKGRLYAETGEKEILFNHQEIEKAFVIDNNEIGGKKR